MSRTIGFQYLLAEGMYIILKKHRNLNTKGLYRRVNCDRIGL